MTDLEFLELPLILEGSCGGGVKEVVQRTDVVSHEARNAGRREELLGIYVRIHYKQRREDQRRREQKRVILGMG